MCPTTVLAPFITRKEQSDFRRQNHGSTPILTPNTGIGASGVRSAVGISRLQRCNARATEWPFLPVCLRGLLGFHLDHHAPPVSRLRRPMHPAPGPLHRSCSVVPARGGAGRLAIGNTHGGVSAAWIRCGWTPPRPAPERARPGTQVQPRVGRRCLVMARRVRDSISRFATCRPNR